MEESREVEAKMVALLGWLKAARGAALVVGGVVGSEKGEVGSSSPMGRGDQDSNFERGK